MGCLNKPPLFMLLQKKMDKFFFRLIPHNFTVSHIEDYLHTPQRTYYEFLSLIQHLGIHSDPEFQKSFWEKSYVQFNKEKYGIDGILFIFLLLCKSDNMTKLNYIKEYLNINIKHSKEHQKLWTMNTDDFKGIMFTYIQCITTISYETYKAVCAEELDDVKNEIKMLDKCFSEEEMKLYVDHLLAPFEKQKYFVNAGEFLERYMTVLSDDMLIRKTIYEFFVKRMTDPNNRMRSMLENDGGDLKKEDDQKDLIGSENRLTGEERV